MAERSDCCMHMWAGAHGALLGALPAVHVPMAALGPAPAHVALLPPPPAGRAQGAATKAELLPDGFMMGPSLLSLNEMHGNYLDHCLNHNVLLTLYHALICIPHARRLLVARFIFST